MMILFAAVIWQLFPDTLLFSTGTLDLSIWFALDRLVLVSFKSFDFFQASFR